MVPLYTLAIWDSPVQLLMVLAIGLLVFGRKLPEMGKNIGKTIVEFKKGLNAATDELKADDKHETKEIPDTNPYNKVVTTAKPSRSVKMLAQTSDEP